MKIYYYIPIALAHESFQFFWINHFEGKLQLKARGIKQAQKKAEKHYKIDKDWNLRFFVSGNIKPNHREKEELKNNYPSKLIIIVIEKPIIYFKDNNSWIEDNTTELTFSIPK